jgi:hypothetical protein
VAGPLQHAALVHVRVVHDLRRVAHRRARDAIGLGARKHLHLRKGARVHSAMSASVSSIWATRAAFVANRGSSIRSSRPIAFKRLVPFVASSRIPISGGPLVGTDGASLPAISCLGAFQTPVARAHTSVVTAGVRKPAHKRPSAHTPERQTLRRSVQSTTTTGYARSRPISKLHG